jgi:hypothetical protein
MAGNGSTEYWEGVNAADRGAGRADNPYDQQKDHYRWSEWEKGWVVGDSDDDE